MKQAVILFCIGFAMLYGITSVQAVDSLGDPFDGNALKNPNWKWKTSDEEGVEPKAWDMGKTKAGWLHIKGELNRNLWPSDTTNRLYQEHEGDFDIETHLFMDYEDACVVAGVVAYSPTTKDHQGREGEWVTIKLWGRGPAQNNNAVIQYQKRQFDGGEGLVGVVPGFPRSGREDGSLHAPPTRERHLYSVVEAESQGYMDRHRRNRTGVRRTAGSRYLCRYLRWQR